MHEDIHVFAVVVEQSSMNKASVILNLSQPALSRKVSKMEEELGVKLFRRVGKRLELTPAGELTYEYALELRKLQRRYMRTLAEFKTARRLPLTVGASLTTLQTTLPDFIHSLTSSLPEIDIKAVTGKTHEIVSLVRDNRVGIGLVASMIDDPQLTCVPLFHDHLQLVVPRNRLLLDKGPLSIKDLNRIPMILFSKGTWYRILTDELFEKFSIKPDIRMEIDSFEAILRLLHTCRAGTLVPQSYLRPQLLEDNDLAIVPIPELAEIKRTTSLIHGDPENLLPLVKSWIDEIAATGFGRSQPSE